MLANFFRPRVTRRTMAQLYAIVVREAREQHWYREGGVSDSFDGRFDMVASILALVLLRLEDVGPETRDKQALLAETFVDDMDGTLRQMGVGDLMVGKHVGKMMGALGGRLTAYREAMAAGGDLTQVVRRNIFRDEAANEEHVAHVVDRLRDLMGMIERTSEAELIAGRWAVE